MEEREELIKNLLEEYEQNFIKAYGFKMNSTQKKAVKKDIEKRVDRSLKKYNENKLTFE